MPAGGRFRKLDSYAVEEAGAEIGLSRAGSYRAAQRGDIPTEKNGRFLRVPRRRWEPDQEQNFADRGGYLASRDSPIPDSEVERKVIFSNC